MSSSMLKPSGFSTYTSLPARTASRAAGTCQWSGVPMVTASMSSRASISRRSRYGVHTLLP